MATEAVAMDLQGSSAAGLVRQRFREYLVHRGVTHAQRILVLHRGSIDHTDRVLQVCRQLEPLSKITMLGNSATLSSFAGHPAVDETISLSRPDLTSLGHCFHVLRQVRKVSYDLIVLARSQWLPVDGMTRIFLRLSKSRCAVVIASEDAVVFDPDDYDRKVRAVLKLNHVSLDEILCPACGHRGVCLFLRKDVYRLVQCRDCHIVSTHPLPTEQELQLLYDQSYTPVSQGYQDLVMAEMAKRSQARERMTQLNRLLPEKGSLLDVGSAFGYFLDEACKDGWKTKGLELSETTARRSREQLGLDVLQSDLFHASFPAQSFDGVTFWDSFEHQRLPTLIVREVHRILRPGGIVAMSLPNVASLTFLVSGRAWYWLTPPMHLYYFTPVSISRYLEKEGFVPVLVITHQGDSEPELPYVVKTILQRLGIDWLLKSLIGGRFEQWLNCLVKRSWVMRLTRWIWKRGWGAEIIIYARRI